MGQTNWDSNEIQFPRLIAEMEAAGLFAVNLDELCESMDLNEGEIMEIVSRAQREWDHIKEMTGREVMCNACDVITLGPICDNFSCKYVGMVKR